MKLFVAFDWSYSVLLKIFFFMWTIFKVFVEFVTIMLLFHISIFLLSGIGDLSSLARDWTPTPCPKHWKVKS